jgi:hypothetical protein
MVFASESHLEVEEHHHLVVEEGRASSMKSRGKTTLDVTSPLPRVSKELLQHDLQRLQIED